MKKKTKNKTKIKKANYSPILIIAAPSPPFLLLCEASKIDMVRAAGIKRNIKLKT